MLIPIPPEVEQNAIVNFLDESRNRIDVEIKKEKKEIRLMNEYKRSLVSDIVLGKLDVRNVH